MTIDSTPVLGYLSSRVKSKFVFVNTLVTRISFFFLQERDPCITGFSQETKEGGEKKKAINQESFYDPYKQKHTSVMMDRVRE